MANFVNLSFLRDGANFLANPLRKVLEAFQSKIILLESGNIDASRLNWAGSPVLPRDVIPPFDQLVGNESTLQASLACLDIYRNGVCQYRDDNSLYFGPGHVLHRGIFKTQTCNDDNSWVSALASSLIIPDECPSGGPVTTSGLDKDTWYYVYWKLDVAGDGPEYRISKIPPVICAGRGPEHPNYDKLRFVGSFKTIDDATTAAIKPFYRGEHGWVYWREVDLGLDPAQNVDPLQSGGFVTTTNVNDFASLVADEVRWYACKNNGAPYIRTDGDSVDPSGVAVVNRGDPAAFTSVTPLNVMDPITGAPKANSQLSLWGDDNGFFSFTIIAYHEALT